MHQGNPEDDFPGSDLDDARLRAILHAIPQKVWSARPDGRHDFYNDRWYEFTGVQPGTTEASGWNSMVHPDDQDRVLDIWNHSRATGEPYETEFRLRHHSGTYRWMLGRAVPARDAKGTVVRWIGTCTDIDALKHTEEARELVTYELSHRIRNVFAVVSSLISLSTKDFPEAGPYAQVILERIGALARAHDFVRSHSPDAAPDNLHGLLGVLVAPYNNGGESCVMITGDDAEVGVHAATALSLIVHELGTNAVKYGALSRQGGKVHIHCETSGDRFVLNWCEEGGPFLEGPPQRIGFGSAMAKKAATVQLGATLVEDWKREGLQLSLATAKGNLRK